MINAIKKLNYLLDKKNKIKLIGIFCLIVLGSFAELMGVTIILPIVNLAMDQGDMQSDFLASNILKFTSASTKEEVLIYMIVLTIVIYIVKNMYVCFVYRKQFGYAAAIKRQYATKLMKSYMEQPYSFFLNRNTSELIRCVNVDTTQLFQVINSLLNLLSNVLSATCIVIFLAVSNLFMTISVSAILGICLIIIVFVLQKQSRVAGKLQQKYGAIMIKHLQQSFGGVKEIKLINAEQYFIDAYDKSYKEATNIDVKFSVQNTIPKYLIEVFAVSSILGFLGYNIMYNPNYLSLIPQISVFCVAAFKLLPSVNAIYANLNSIVFYRASIDVVYRDIREVENISVRFDEGELAEKMPFDSEITLKGITYRYENAESDVFQDVSLTIEKGKSVAFIGASGGGKTTLADICLSILTPTKGKVLVDGQDISDNIWGWRKHLGYIPQNIFLTDDTIKSNVAFGTPVAEIDDAKVWKALEEAQLREFVESLPEGLDTVVGERGARISGGQRQRIGIARALYRDPDVLVFDEATSALDNDTEKEVMKAIDALQGLKTMIIIAHRLSTIENCDHVFKIEGGHVEQER